MRKVKRKKNQILNYDIEKEMEFLNNITLRKGIIKISALFLLVSLNWTGLGQIGQTLSYFSDTENSPSNAYSAGTLEMSLRSGQDNFVPKNKSEDLKPGDTITRDIYIKKEGSLPFKYTASAEPISDSCDQELFDALELKFYYNYYTQEPDYPGHHGHRTMSLKYDGLLKDFDLRALDANDPHLQIPNNNEYFENIFYDLDEHWFYASEIILPENVSAELQNKSCNFNFVFEAWQTNFEEPNGGFSDTEEVSNYVATSNWMPEVEITYPIGEEVWYLVPDNHSYGAWCVTKDMNENCEYEIKWNAENTIGDDMDLLIDIYFSNDSGTTWFAQIGSEEENTGSFFWKPPYDSDYITSNGRIKIVATHKDYSFLQSEDQSEDFCPPMMTEFEMNEMMRALSIENGSYGDETDDEIVEEKEKADNDDKDKPVQEEELTDIKEEDEVEKGEGEEQEEQGPGDEEEPILEPEVGPEDDEGEENTEEDSKDEEQSGDEGDSVLEPETDQKDEDGAEDNENVEEEDGDEINKDVEEEEGFGEEEDAEDEIIDDETVETVENEENDEEDREEEIEEQEQPTQEEEPIDVEEENQETEDNNQEDEQEND